MVRLLKGVLKGHVTSTSTADGAEDTRSEKAKLPYSARASILGRVLISRVYGHDDLQAVLGELEEGVPFQRLWSTGGRQKKDNHLPMADNQGQNTEDANASSNATPDVVIFTEMDHHFKWLRLQSNGGRLYELYGQLMRRLRALASVGTGTNVSGSQRWLIFVLNSTLARRPAAGTPSLGIAVAAAADDCALDGGDDRQHTQAPPQAADQDAAFRLVLAVLQQGLHSGRADVFRLCCNELAKVQCIEPQYKTLLDYYCSLHICLTRLPVDLVDLWGGYEGGSMGPPDSSLWVATVESDEAEISQHVADRAGVVYQTRGIVQNAAVP